MDTVLPTSRAGVCYLASLRFSINLTSTQTPVRAVAGCHHSVPSAAILAYQVMSPVSIMSTRLSLTALGNIGRVQSPPEAIEFATKVKAWCNTNGVPWWYSCVVSEHHSEEAKAKNIRDKARAQRLDYLKQIEIDGYLCPCLVPT